MAALLDQGKTAIRDSLKSLITHVGVSTASDVFSSAHTVIDPTPGTNLIKTSSEANVDGNTFDATMTIDGTTEFTNSTIRTISVLNGSTRTAALSRTVRSLGIGVEAGDSYVVGIRVACQDNSA